MLEYLCLKCGLKRDDAKTLCPKCGSNYVYAVEPVFQAFAEGIIPRIESLEGQIAMENTHPLSGNVYKFSFDDAFKSPDLEPDKYDWLRARHKDN